MASKAPAPSSAQLLAFYKAQQQHLRAVNVPSTAAQRDVEQARPLTKAELTEAYMGMLGLSPAAIKEARSTWTLAGICIAFGPVAIQLASIVPAIYMMTREDHDFQARKNYFMGTLAVALATSFVNAVTQLYFVALNELVADRQSNRLKEMKAPEYPELTNGFRANNEMMAKLDHALETLDGQAKKVLAQQGTVEENNTEFKQKFEKLLEEMLPFLPEEVANEIGPSRVALSSAMEQTSPSGDVIAQAVSTCLQKLLEQAAPAVMAKHDETQRKFEARSMVIDLNFKSQAAQNIIRNVVTATTCISLMASRSEDVPRDTAFWGQTVARVFGLFAGFWGAGKGFRDKFQATFDAAAQGVTIPTKAALESGKAYDAMTEQDMDTERWKSDPPLRLQRDAALTQLGEQWRVERAAALLASFDGMTVADALGMRQIGLHHFAAADPVTSSPTTLSDLAHQLTAHAVTGRAATPIDSDGLERLEKLRKKQKDMEKNNLSLNAADTAELEKLKKMELARGCELATRYKRLSLQPELESMINDIDELDKDLKRLKNGEWGDVSKERLEFMALALNTSLPAKMKMAWRTALARYRLTSEFVSQWAQRVGSAHALLVLGTNTMLAVSGGLAMENARRREAGLAPLPPMATGGVTAALTVVTLLITHGYGHNINRKITSRAEARENKTKGFQDPAWIRADTAFFALKQAAIAMIAIPIGWHQARAVREAAGRGEALKKALQETVQRLAPTPRSVAEPSLRGTATARITGRTIPI